MSSPQASTAATSPRPSNATRERILDEAEVLFANSGFAGTSVRDIATAAGLTPASLYNHFSNKNARVVRSHSREDRTERPFSHLAARLFGATLCAMVTIGMNYDVISGKEEVFEGACKKVLDVMNEAEGHDNSQIFRRVDIHESAQYLIVSRWKDESAFNEFIASETFKKVTSWGLANVLAGRPSHTTYHEG